ncbi:CPBP family intramembrane glutamic endopeptidase [Bacillus sp. CGMCC 1.16607]|uniref:CPBP family intramembrane glutamic endopeptidase n=1 Tax=Bacillus sp. CGMCC 1.16607 TaxID=3351842 RepID=UPI0036399ECB
MTKYTSKELLGKPDNKLSKGKLTFIITIQTLIIVALCAALGIYFGPKVGLTDRFLQGITQGELHLSDFYLQLKIGALAGIVCSLTWMISYYGFIRHRLDRESLFITENLRHQLGLWTRVTSGGITEEVIFRWGLLSLVMWLFSLLISSETTVFWIAITVTGMIFGLAHLPGNLAAGCKPSVMLVTTAIIGNLWVSVFCGYLFWKYGLIAAIIVHILFHVLWYPWDQVAYKKLKNEVNL